MELSVTGAQPRGGGGSQRLPPKPFLPDTETGKPSSAARSRLSSTVGQLHHQRRSRGSLTLWRFDSGVHIKI